ncbi:sensor histidine kinase [Paenibacillus sp. CAA11]|uniref:HAMP domain-containing sensor histidine kinase n=1 Tax=Paenibacillus sp. CAA11 TaxID=1532905 RepID=UPI000D3D03ED|nr:HAMP domain-containing sensor histidine kinase [Paenibacillus sp. CAA11]AWB43728.1 sensor histidine kinase [Paenibacillus sp. CAA11]
MNKNSLFYRLIKTYVFFACTMGIVELVFVAFMVHVEGGTIDIRLQWLLFFLLVFGLHVWIYSLWTSRRVTRPLEEIAGAIREMKQGRFHERLHIQASHEFLQIQTDFNDMAETLQRAEAENLKLQESKQRMLVDISHDLKTPITTIQGYAQALQLGIVTDEEQRRKYLQLIYSKSTLVTGLIDDIFNLSKLDSPDIPLHAVPGDLAELLREAAAEYYEQFEAKEFTLQLDIPPIEVIVSYDEKLLQRAVTNLLSNALRYNPPGTEVTLRLEDLGSAVHLSVIDNGIGISDELKAVIFDPFVRGDASRKGDGGTGLGLSIARQIVRLHGGELSLNNQPGQTSFELVLYHEGNLKRTL